MSIRISEREYHIPLLFFPIVTVIIFSVIFSSGCVDLTSAYISDHVLTEGWEEDTSLRNSGSQFLGLEKWASVTYSVGGNYPATITITTIKSLVMMDENKLLQKTKETINSTIKESITLNISSESTGERYTLNDHKTRYILYNGTDNISNSTYEEVKTIGEIWNCATSGTSVICIGVAYITDNEDNSSSTNTDNWEKMIKDLEGTIEDYTGEDGLIYNVACH